MKVNLPQLYVSILKYLDNGKTAQDVFAFSQKLNS